MLTISSNVNPVMACSLALVYKDLGTARSSGLSSYGCRGIGALAAAKHYQTITAGAEGEMHYSGGSTITLI